VTKHHTLALPSKGALSQPTLDFLKHSGVKVWKPNPRQYTGTIPAIDGLNVMFQRVKDVVYKVSDGTAQLGITGLDVVYEVC
jgi:ATP phosphoribosyltransferase